MAKRVLVAVRPRRSSFGSTTVGGGSSGWSSSGASTWRCPGSCAGAACAAASGSPITRPFALPRKRFTQQPVLEKGGEYLGTEQSYAQTVQHQGMPIMYDDRTPTGLEKASGLAPSTVWRWLSWLGGMPGTLRAAWDLIRQKEPNATLHRQAWVVSPRKYRSEQRRDTLVRAMQLLAADRVCEKILGKGIFPSYAISQGWS
jgi:hypothetical protein